MPHQDDVNLRKNLTTIKAVLDQLVTEDVAEFQRHGNAKLSPTWLAMVAIVSLGWISDGPLDQRVSAACAVVNSLGATVVTVTRQGLLKALATCGQALVERIVDHLMVTLAALKGQWTRDGKVNLAVDGTKYGAPRTAANQAAFSAAGSATPRSNAKKQRRQGKKNRRRGLKGRPAATRKVKAYKSVAAAKKAASVQVLLTAIWHLTTGLPLRWLITGVTGSERKSTEAMIDAFPKNARLIGDAEYVGYPLWSAVMNSGRSFLFRVGSNITLLKNLCHVKKINGDLVYCWPETAMQAGQPPLTLRLIQLHTGRKAIYLVTNELDMPAEKAADLYKQRWGVEVFFRTVKQTCQRSKLRCGTPENVRSELNWTLLGIWAALYLGKQTLHEEGLQLHRLSPVKVLRALTATLQHIVRSQHRIALLTEVLGEALLTDESHRPTRSKKSRDYPRKKKHKRCGAPIIKLATKQQQQKALKMGF